MTSGRIIGAEWANKYPDRFRGRPLTPYACAVCGHPTGSCTGDHDANTDDTATVPEAENGG